LRRGRIRGAELKRLTLLTQFPFNGLVLKCVIINRWIATKAVVGCWRIGF